MTDREAILGRVRDALAPLGSERAAYPQWQAAMAVARGREAGGWEAFQERLEAAHGVFLEGWPALAKFLEAQACKSGYVAAKLLAEAGPFLDSFSVESNLERARIDDYAFAVTPASFVIAETGTIVLRDHDCPHRLAALAPWVHVAVVRRSDCVATMPEAIARMGDDPSIVFATGPSKTADIEGILIEGVHGPGCQACCVID